MRVYVPQELQEEYKRTESEHRFQELKRMWPKLTQWQKYQLCLIACKDKEAPLKDRISLFFTSTFYFLTNQ